MSLKPRYFAPLFIATGAAASIAVAPVAAADDPWPDWDDDIGDIVIGFGS
ncbi:hypothetical protein [Mycobacterium sp.]